MRQPSTHHSILALILCSTVCLISSSPLPHPAGNQELDLLQIPLANGKEIDVLTLGAKDQEQLIADRNKRTIGLLRELFPDITKQIDEQANRIISKLLRTLGPTVLRTAIQGNTANAARDTFDADFDDDDDDQTKSDQSSSSSSSGSSSGTRVSIELPTFEPDDENEIDANEKTSSTSSTTTTTTTSTNGATDTKIDLSAINKQLEETIRVARQVKEAEAAAAAAAAQQSSGGSPIAQAPIPLKSNEPIQLSFNNELPTVNVGNSGIDDVKALSTNDLQQSESKSPAIDDLSLDSAEDTADVDDRNKSNLFKRFLSFGGAGLAGGSSGGATPGGNSLGGGAAGGGSGNFLLDAVRLFSGSVQTQQGDEAANSVGGGVSGSTDDTDGSGDSTRTADGYTEGIPGPVTRLVVLANRGLANLVQDLILRVAATSEKFVNFKAKLITALI
ncbi:GH11811 [Drosophila grimshawi]|uniref:GH11811 n=1 Tax=Drosophila grimshawi TaxID=7222 RepID=B4JIS3_DROGR|nr:GH11811 [Drosophila grimshawi]